MHYYYKPPIPFKESIQLTIFTTYFTSYMKQILFGLFGLIVLAACAPNSKNTTITIEVKGLKKGTLYLQKLTESGLINLDSVQANGRSTLSLGYDLSQPELLYAYLDKKDASEFNDRIPFFAEPGAIHIETELNAFESKAVITAGGEQEQFEKVQQMLSKFATKDFELLQLAQSEKAKNQKFVDSLIEASNTNNLRRYQFIVNYALVHPKSYVAAYLVAEEGVELTPKWRDSIFNSFSEDIKNSSFGQKINSQLSQ